MIQEEIKLCRIFMIQWGMVQTEKSKVYIKGSPEKNKFYIILLLFNILKPMQYKILPNSHLSYSILKNIKTRSVFQYAYTDECIVVILLLQIRQKQPQLQQQDVLLWHQQPIKMS